MLNLRRLFCEAGLCIILLLVCLNGTLGSPNVHTLVLGGKGLSCEVVCATQGRQCSQARPKEIDEMEGHTMGALKSLLAQEGSSCAIIDGKNASGPWPGVEINGDQGTCVGWKQVSPLSCNGKRQNLRRLCRCGASNTDALLFGTGCSNCVVGPSEETIFFHAVDPGNYGLMTHFWSTAPSLTEGNIIIRYYVDGEVNASIEFNPSMASGVGFNDDSQAPWGTKWVGLGAGNGRGSAWWNNFRVPFWSNITITAQSPVSTDGFYIIVRGGLNVPLNIGTGTQLQPGTKLKLYKFSQTVDPLEWVPVVNVSDPNTSGFFFAHTIAVETGDLNFLEGCYHAFSPVTQEFPGTLLSTGTEDFFDSGWYFNAGKFRFPVSGFTHESSNATSLTWSAYRFHEMDPIQFNQGLLILWRNGDETDPITGEKCFTQSGGNIVGAPTKSQVEIYAWVYQWNNS